MSRRAWLTADGTIVRVHGYLVADELRGAGFRPLYVGTLRSWVLDRKRLGDVLEAALDDEIELGMKPMSVTRYGQQIVRQGIQSCDAARAQA